MKEYGISASFSMVENEDGVMAGLHYTDTEDLDVDVSVEGENREEVMQALIEETLEETLKHSLAASIKEEPEPEMTYEALQEENTQLRDEIKFLRARLNDVYDEAGIFQMSLFEEDAQDNVSDNKGNQNADSIFTDEELETVAEALKDFLAFLR